MKDRLFDNDKERIEFLEDYRNTSMGWYLWKEDNDILRRMWRFDLDECALIVEEAFRTVHHTEYTDNHLVSTEKLEWQKLNWYVVRDWEYTTFEDQRGSRSLALTALKECIKNRSRKGAEDGAV